MRLVVFIATLGLFFPFLTTPLTSLVQSEEEYEAAMKEIDDEITENARSPWFKK